MSFFGTRRPRQSQARVFRPTPSLWDRLIAAFRDYRVLSILDRDVSCTLAALLASGMEAPLPLSRWPVC